MVTFALDIDTSCATDDTCWSRWFVCTISPFSQSFPYYFLIISHTRTFLFSEHFIKAWGREGLHVTFFFLFPLVVFVVTFPCFVPVLFNLVFAFHLQKQLTLYMFIISIISCLTHWHIACQWLSIYSKMMFNFLTWKQRWRFHSIKISNECFAELLTTPKSPSELSAQPGFKWLSLVKGYSNLVTSWSTGKETTAEDWNRETASWNRAGAAGSRCSS